MLDLCLLKPNMVLGGMKNSHTAPGCLYDKGVNICNPYAFQVFVLFLD